MAISKGAANVVMLAGAYQIFIAVTVPFKMLGMISKYPNDASSIFLAMPAIAVLWIIVGIFLRKSGKMMLDERICKKGCKRALIFSILGLNIISLMGAIVGLIKSRH